LRLTKSADDISVPATSGKTISSGNFQLTYNSHDETGIHFTATLDDSTTTPFSADLRAYNSSVGEH